MLDWSKYFDRIYCLHYCQYTERKELLDFELNRVSILNSGIFEYWLTYPNQDKFALYMKKNLVQHYNPEINWHYINVALGHYYITRDAYYRGYKNILILEDDIRFLKDLNKIEQILDNKPKDVNIILYDKFIWNYNANKQFKFINKYYSTFNSCWSAACYELDRVGMYKLLNLYENVEFRNPDNYFFNTNLYLNDVICCCSNTNLGVQVQFKHSQTQYYNENILHCEILNIIFKGYKYINIDWDNYMIKQDGSPYYYGDYIEQKKENHQLILTNESDKQIIQTNKPIQPIQMNICLAVTINYIDKLLPIIYSLQKYSQSKFNVYIIINTQKVQMYEEYFKPFINQKMNIKLISSKIIDDNLNRNYSKRLTNLTYAKLVIPTLFPDLDRILYLDYDTIILNKGLQWFYNIDFRNHYAAACEDMVIYDQLEWYDQWETGREEGKIFKDSLLYFNAGVLLLNLKRIRELGLDKKMFNSLQSFNKPLLLEDQSLLNYIFKNATLHINPIFNSFCPQITHCFENIIWKKEVKKNFNIDSKEQYFKSVIIAHFACWSKPWRCNIDRLKDEAKFVTFNKYEALKNETLEKIYEYYMA